MAANMEAQWTAIVLAGQRPGPDLLAEQAGVPLKALIPIHGKPMVRHVVEALDRTPAIARIVVLGQKTGELRAALRNPAAHIRFVTGVEGISRSIRNVAGGPDAPWPILVTTADHPLLTSKILTGFLDAADGDVAVGMVERATMMARFPDNRRTWLKLRDGQWSGANLFALRNDRADKALELWEGAEGDRKKALKLFAHFGPWFALRAATRTIGLADGLKIAGRRLGLDARLVPLADPVAAIDVDKPADLELARAIMGERAGGRSED